VPASLRREVTGIGASAPVHIDEWSSQMIKVRKNAKVKIWNVYASNGESLGQYSFYVAEVKAYFPGCTIQKQNVYLP